MTLDSYEDDAVGFLENDGGKLWIDEGHPAARGSFPMPTPPLLAEIHHLAHEACFIANSVKTDVIVEPR